LLYQSQGRYGEAEPALAEALQLSREVLGQRHPDTLISVNNLAGLYEAQGVREASSSVVSCRPSTLPDIRPGA
jgi:Tetratricopeptide repeat